MPDNLSNFRLRYAHETDVDLLEVFLNLSSTNFDINQEVLGPSTPFTSELLFDLKLEQNAAVKYKTSKALADRLETHFGVLPGNTSVEKITSFFKSEVFNGTNLAVEFDNIKVGWEHPDANDPNFPVTDIAYPDTNFLHVLINQPGNSDSNELFNLQWSVKIKFHASPPEMTTTNLDDDVETIHALDEPVVMFPQLVFLSPETLASPSGDTSADIFNDELRLNKELLYQPSAQFQSAPTGDLTSPLGKVADEISDSFASLASTLATNLTGTFRTQLQPVGNAISNDVALWILIKKATDDLGFDNFARYMNAVFCGDTEPSHQAIANRVRNAGKLTDLNSRRHLPFPAVDAYRSVKVATEAFVMVNCMVDDGGFDQRDLDELSAKVPLSNGIPDPQALDKYWDEYRVKVNGGDSVIPYLAVIREKMGDENFKNSTFEAAFNTYSGLLSDSFETGQCYGIIREKLTQPCFLELIWSYWMEESMMVQGLKAILRRFQNIRAPGARDPLANLLIDPLRPLSNLMWGYAQDEQNRLTVLRRSYEYNSHYGISPHGDVLKNMRFADSRSRFMEAFHTLLNLTSKFYRQADDMTVKPDGFPILNALKETHLILSEGAHNQYGDLPFTARTEMLMEQWLLSRSEFREFLPTRIMVAYPEPWMDRVSALNQLMGWTNTSILHFRDLARFGEQILLSVRFGNWANTNSRDAASNWAQFWREQIQGYIHGYRAVTGVDLTADLQAGKRIDAQQPSVHLRRLLAEQQSRSGSNGFSSNGHGARKRAFADVDEI